MSRKQIIPKQWLLLTFLFIGPIFGAELSSNHDCHCSTCTDIRMSPFLNPFPSTMQLWCDIFLIPKWAKNLSRVKSFLDYIQLSLFLQTPQQQVKLDQSESSALPSSSKQSWSYHRLLTKQFPFSHSVLTHYLRTKQTTYHLQTYLLSQ